MIDWEILKDVAEAVSALGAVVAAWQSWMAHEKGVQIQAKITAVQNQINQMTSNQSVTVVVNTAAQTAGSAFVASALPKPKD